MKIFLINFCLFLCYSLHLFPFDTVCICAIFRDEAPWLSEWIEFHISQGVGHFYLYDNLSCDHPQEVLDRYKDHVTVIEWPYDYKRIEEWNEIQCSAYMDCVNQFGKQAQWMAFLDTDEFLFCPDGKNLKVFLKNYELYGAIAVHWVLYGTSNINIPYGEKMLDYLVMRAPYSYHGNELFKVIAQTRYIKDISNPHVLKLRFSKFTVDETKNIVDDSRSSFFHADKIRINHYWARDLSYFLNIKLPRREKWFGNIETEIQMEREMNEVYDPILSKNPLSI